MFSWWEAEGEKGQVIGPDKTLAFNQTVWIFFSYFIIKMCVVGTIRSASSTEIISFDWNDNLYFRWRIFKRKYRQLSLSRSKGVSQIFYSSQHITFAENWGKIKRTTTFHIWIIYVNWPLKLEIYWKPAFAAMHGPYSLSVAFVHRHTTVYLWFCFNIL